MRVFAFLCVLLVVLTFLSLSNGAVSISAADCMYIILKAIGFETSHSITSLDTYFISKKECINSARLMNSGSAKDREIGLDPGIKIRYICLAKPKIGLNT